MHWVLTRGIIPGRRVMIRIWRWLAQDIEKLPVGYGECVRAVPISAVEPSRKRGFRRGIFDPR